MGLYGREIARMLLLRMIPIGGHVRAKGSVDLVRRRICLWPFISSSRGSEVGIFLMPETSCGLLLYFSDGDITFIVSLWFWMHAVVLRILFFFYRVWLLVSFFSYV